MFTWLDLTNQQEVSWAWMVVDLVSEGLRAQGRRKRGAGGARAPPLFGIEKKKKKGRRRRKKGKESVHPVPDRDVYMYKKISPSNCSKMYKTPELPGAPPLDPIRFELGCASAPSQLIFPLSNLVPPPHWRTGGWVGGGGGEPARPPPK